MRYQQCLTGFIAVGLVIALGIPLRAQALSSENLKDVSYWSDLCQQQFNAKEYDAALQACDQAIALSMPKPNFLGIKRKPRGIELANLWTQRSGILIKIGKFSEAIAAANLALKIEDQHSLASTYQCVAYSQLGHTDFALDACAQALRIDGNWGRENPAMAWFHRGNIFRTAQQYERAVIAYDRMLLLEPNDSLALTYRCDSQIVLGQYDLALQSCQQALTGNGRWENQGPALAWTHQGRAQTLLGQYEAAIAAYDKAIALDPENALTWASQGDLFASLHRDSDGLLSFQQAIALAENYAQALLGQCTILNRLGDYATALTACDAAISGDDDWGRQDLPKALNQRSIALTQLGQYQQAQASVNRAIGLDPGFVEAYHHRSIVLWYQGLYAAALTANKKAIELDEHYAPAWLSRGVILRAMQKYPEALAAYDQALEIDPFNAWGWSNRSVVLWQQTNYAAALASAEKAAALSPKLTSAWYNQGAAMTALGLFDDAIAAYGKVLALEADNADALTGRGIAQAKLGDFEAAAVDLQAALAINPNHAIAQKNFKSLPQP